MLRAMVWALVLAGGAAAAVRADVVGVDWTSPGTPPKATVTGTLQGKTVTLTTNAVSNAGALTATGWANAVFYPSSLGAFAPAEATTIGFLKNGVAQNQSVAFSSAITGPNIYLLFNYVESGTVYDFTGLNPTMVSTSFNSGSTATLSGQEVTYTTTNGSSNLEGFIVRLSGTSYSNIAFTTRNSSGGSGSNWFTVGVGTAVPEPGTLLLGGLAAACGGGGVWWRRRKRLPAPVEAGAESETV